MWLLQSDVDGFGLGVFVDRAFPELASPAGLLVAAEREYGVECVVAVDPYGAGRRSLAETAVIGLDTFRQCFNISRQGVD
jgi:hypothetical protein